MIRLAIPLFLLTLVFWGMFFAIRGDLGKQTRKSFKQWGIAGTIAASVLLALSIAFSLGGYING